MIYKVKKQEQDQEMMTEMKPVRIFLAFCNIVALGNAMLKGLLLQSFFVHKNNNEHEKVI
jgi:hypothetical protein